MYNLVHVLLLELSPVFVLHVSCTVNTRPGREQVPSCIFIYHEEKSKKKNRPIVILTPRLILHY